MHTFTERVRGIYRFFTATRRRTWMSAIGTLVLLVVIIVLLTRGGTKATAPIEVLRGTVSETVSVTGSATAAENVSLAFEVGGRVASIRKMVGDSVFRGETIAALDQSEFAANLQNAQGVLDAANARLSEYERGARPEDIAVKEALLAQQVQDLDNAYQGVLDVLQDAYSSTDGAIRNTLDPLFSNDEFASVALSFTVSDSQKKIDAERGRLQIGAQLNVWRTELDALGASAHPSALDSALARGADQLVSARTFIGTVMDAVTSATGLSSTTQNLYASYATTARATVNSGLASVNTRRQALASAALAVQKAQNDLTLLRAGTDPEQIAAQKAVVRQAEASVAAAQAQMSKRVLHSPLDGVVTLQDAKVGEIISANKAIAAVIANTGFEIEANIPEVDVAKLAVGNPVRITFDAFPQIPFTGTVSHIDPGETIVDGVVNFKVKVTLAQSPDLSRVRNGLTANLSIETRRREQVLILPQYAVLDTDHGPIVRKLVNGYATETPVTLGVRGEDGTVEILSGLSEHDLVENIGIRSAE